MRSFVILRTGARPPRSLVNQSNLPNEGTFRPVPLGPDRRSFLGENAGPTELFPGRPEPRTRTPPGNQIGLLASTQ